MDKKFGISWSLNWILAVTVVGTGWSQDYVYERAPFDYWSESVHTRISEIEQRVTKGQLKLPLAEPKEALSLLLKECNIPVESQVVVFSKTSLQRDRITPTNPRVIYFNERTYIGWVPGGLLELTDFHPELGPIFYQLDLDRPDRKTPKFDRSETCMSCHAGGMTDNLPGLMSRSVYPNDRGEPLFQAGTSLIDQQSPLEMRWGGWYVTGNHGSLVHRGNAFAEMVGNTAVINTKTTSNKATLDAYFDTSRYLRSTSDIVALLVLDHQVGMHQRLTKASYDVRLAIKRRTDLLKELKEKEEEILSGSALSVAKSHVEKILEFLLFCGEAALPEDGIEGSPEFQKAFTSTRKATKGGRSLKDFQLLSRIFKYRCSYLIYSPEWDALPKPFLDMLNRRLHDILTSPTPVAGYEHLSATERENILSILQETKPTLPPYWFERT